MSKLKLPEFTYQAIPLSPDDLLEVTTIAVSFPIVIEIEGTALDMAGALVPFRFVQNIAATVTPTINRFRLGYQGLLSVVVHTHTAGIPDGDCYSQITLCKSQSRGVFPHRKVLAIGYIATHSSIGYGSDSINGAPREHFFIQNILISDPAAGADFAYVCPNFTLIIPIHVTFTFVSDATVINRYPNLVFRRPPGVDHYVQSTLAIAASTTRFPSYYDMSINAFGTGKDTQSIPLPPIPLTSGSTLLTDVSSIQAGDQISDISIYCKRTTIPF